MFSVYDFSGCFNPDPTTSGAATTGRIVNPTTGGVFVFLFDSKKRLSRVVLGERDERGDSERE